MFIEKDKSQKDEQLDIRPQKLLQDISLMKLVGFKILLVALHYFMSVYGFMWNIM